MSLKLRRNKLLYSLIVGLCDNQINALLPTKLIDKLKKEIGDEIGRFFVSVAVGRFCLFVVNRLV